MNVSFKAENDFSDNCPTRDGSFSWISIANKKIQFSPRPLSVHVISCAVIMLIEIERTNKWKLSVSLFDFGFSPIKEKYLFYKRKNCVYILHENWEKEEKHELIIHNSHKKRISSFRLHHWLPTAFYIETRPSESISKGNKTLAEWKNNKILHD